MNNIDVSIDKLYGTGEILDRISNGLNLADKDVNYLTVDDLSPVDEFHTRGRESTLEVAELIDLKPSDVVLEVGCGLGGTARHLADLYKCRVIGIDLTEEYVAVGTKLTKLVGLATGWNFAKATHSNYLTKMKCSILFGLNMYR